MGYPFDDHHIRASPLQCGISLEKTAVPGCASVVAGLVVDARGLLRR
jgi:hypothetical protein